MSTAQPGWYPDPQGFGTLRWFDGERWTEHRAPAPQPGQDAPTTPAQPSPAGYGPTTYGQTAYAQTGYAQTGYAQPGYGYPGQPMAWQPPAQQGRSGGVKALIVVGAILGTLVLVGVVAAVAIPVFLDQRDQAERSELADLTCEDANADAVRLSLEQTPDDMVALTSVTGSTLTVDNRRTVETPAAGGEALVMTCEGDGLWADGVTTRVWVELWLLDDRSLEVGVRWDE